MGDDFRFKGLENIVVLGDVVMFEIARKLLEKYHECL